MIKCKGFLCFVLFFLVFSWFVQACFAVDKVDADGALIDAENVLASAYVAVAEAKRAGANVSELLVKLDFAGTLLADAYNAYRLGDYDEAYLYATNCSGKVNGIVSEAASLKLEAENAYSEKLFSTEVLSSVGLCLLFVLSLFGWRFLKKKYLKRVLEMKPEMEAEAK